MGFLELIPADELSATYDGVELTLSAQGQVQDSTTGITFSRQPWAGGLKFDLEGWVGPLMDSHSKYKHEQNFHIHLPNPVFSSRYVIIVDQNNPQGVRVPILGIPEDKSPAHKKLLSQESGQGKGPTPTEPQVELPEDVHLTEVVHKSFLIKEKVEASNYGTINIKFDKNFLDLKSAGIQVGNVFWEFVPVKTGKTQILVTVYGGVRPIVFRQTYEATILARETVRDG
jgi:hypothetical protein